MLGSRVDLCHDLRVFTSTVSEHAGRVRLRNGRRVPARFTCMAFAPDRLNDGQHTAQQHNLKVALICTGKQSMHVMQIAIALAESMPLGARVGVCQMMFYLVIV